MLCFERKSMITIFWILIVMDLMVTPGLPKFTPQHQLFKRQMLAESQCFSSYFLFLINIQGAIELNNEEKLEKLGLFILERRRSERALTEIPASSVEKVPLQKCPPGKYRVPPYSGNNQTNCAPCADGTYTEMKNSLTECRKCDGRCTGNTVQTVPCTPTTNRKCECAPHHYCATPDTTMCEQCKKCGEKARLLPGKEDYYKQACQPCPLGTFLNTTQTLRCQPHTNCTVLGKTLHTEGNSTTDNHCVDPTTTIRPVTVPCIPKKDKKCECPLGHYCARCGDKKLLLPGKEDYDNQVCQPCPPGTFLNITQMLTCQPHSNCTDLGMSVQTEGNSTADNYCVGPMIPGIPIGIHQKDKTSFHPYMVCTVVVLCIICAVIILKSSLCKISNKQGIGMLVKLKFICICVSKNDLYKSGDDEAEVSVETTPETGAQCVCDHVSDSKPTTVMMPLISTKETEAPTLEYKSEILDIEMVSGVVDIKDSAEDEIPFPVQENGRNSNTYYPIKEQGRMQDYQPVMMEAKYGPQKSL